VLALLERHAPHRTAHASLIAEIRGLYAGARRVPRPPVPGPLAEPLSGSEIRVLRYLPTNLTAPEIARELSVSPNTVRTHIKSLYAKLGTHRRAAAVERARALGLLAPSAGAGRHQPVPYRGLPAGISSSCMRLPGHPARHAEHSHDDGSRGSSDRSRRTSMSSRPSASASASTPYTAA